MTDQDLLQAPGTPEEASRVTPEGDPMETAEPVPAPTRRSSGVARFALFLAFLAFVLVLGAGGAGGWYLWQDYQARPQRAAELAALKRDLADRATRAELAQAGQQPMQGLNALRQQLGTVQQSLAGTRTELGGQVERLQQLEQRVNRNQRGWVLAETAYLLRMASYRLQLARDRTSAIAALDAADQALMRLGEIDLLPVREAIAGEIAKLRRLPRPDPEGVALALGELQKEIGGLPVKGASQGAAAQAAAVPRTGSEVGDEVGGWRAVLNRFVVVSRTDGQSTPAPDPERFATARRKLHTALEMARLSAVRLDLELFRDSIARARALLDEGFETADAKVVDYADRLAAQVARLNVGEPARIGAARRLLDDFIAADRASMQEVN